MRGYKVFNSDWTYCDFQYAVGKTYEEDVTPPCCNGGFHFCTDLKDCFNYYDFDPSNKVAEIEALGEIDTETGGSKHCTNKIKIVRELSWEEVLKMVNMGKANTGFNNSGNFNSGDLNNGNHNSGNQNNGDRNSGGYNNGDFNSGNCNSGSCNSGSCNSGDWNSGNYNTGYCNTGDWNNGDWNKTDFSSGCFNTKESKILMFNKPSNWTFRDWRNSTARQILDEIRCNTLEWVDVDDMTNKEKDQRPECKTTGGYLSNKNKSKYNQLWWNNLRSDKKDIIKSLPNFDAEIFKEITGIDVTI